MTDAERLADALEELDAHFSQSGVCKEAAFELRRQHDESKRLDKQCQGLVEALVWIQKRCPEYFFLDGRADNRHYEAAFDVRSCAKAALKRVEQE